MTIRSFLAWVPIDGILLPVMPVIIGSGRPLLGHSPTDTTMALGSVQTLLNGFRSSVAEWPGRGLSDRQTHWCWHQLTQVSGAPGTRRTITPFLNGFNRGLTD